MVVVNFLEEWKRKKKNFSKKSTIFINKNKNFSKMIFEEDMFDIKDIDKDGKMFEKGLRQITFF